VWYVVVGGQTNYFVTPNSVEAVVPEFGENPTLKPAKLFNRYIPQVSNELQGTTIVQWSQND
jgi:hypothetical protein